MSWRDWLSPKRRQDKPLRHCVTLRPSGHVLDVGGDQTVLEAALEAGLPFPHQCRAAMCRSCRCRLVSGEIAPRKPMAPALTAEELENGMILACQAQPCTPLEIHVEPRGNRPIPPAGDQTAGISS